MEGMTESSSGLRYGESSSQAQQQGSERDSLDELDGDEAADLSLDNALLNDDPLDEDIKKAS